MSLLVQADGATTAYEVVGSGPRTLTCLHSLALSGGWFRPLAAELGDGYRIVLPDLRGHGASAAGDTTISLGLLADDVHALWRQLGIEHSDVLGISLGGMVAQALAARYADDVDHLVLIATTAAYDESARAAARERAAAARAPGGLAAMVDPLLERWLGHDPDDVLVARARREVLAADPQVHGAVLEAMTDVGSYDLGVQPPPTLVLGAEDDASAPRPVIEALAAAVPGAELGFVPGAHLTAFTHPADVVRRVRPFLEHTNGDQ